MRVKLSLLFVFMLLFTSLSKAEGWFYLEVKVITTGENQPQREIGTFAAEVPENGKGNLQRSVVIKNQTRNKSNEVDFKITFQPQKTESGAIHILFTSEATPKVGKSENKFRDLMFNQRSNQIVEIYSDTETGTHILISLSINEKEVEKENIENIKVAFKCKVEKIKGNEKEVIDTYDLQTVGENPVKRVLTQKVPVWVEGDSGEISATGFKKIDSGNKPVYLKAGEGFTYTPPISKKAKTNSEKKSAAKKKIDSRIPSKYQKQEETSETPTETKEEKSEETPKPPPSPSGSFNWEKEEFSYEISVLEASKGNIKSKIKMEGVLFDPVQKQLKPLQSKEETKTFSNGEIVTLVLQREDQEGFILTIQAYF
jgi:hypothetical protein